jgi:signal transduction histidine kinase
VTDLLDRRKTLHRQIEDFEGQLEVMEDKLSQLQPLADLGTVWSMTAHELNNMLMPIINYSQLALQNPDDAELNQKALQKALLLSERAGLVLKKVMALANSSDFQKQMHCFGDVLDDVFACIGRDFSKDKIRVIRNFDENIQIAADLTTIQQVLMNLLINARQAMTPKGGQLTISAAESADGTRIEIADTGKGICPEQLKNIFTPFYTSGKEDGNGLGLAFCQKVIEKHQGCITVESQLNRGTHFKILLPKYAE